MNQSSGPLDLTEEEKKTLQAEGYDIPTSFPLSKVDERNLKKVKIIYLFYYTITPFLLPKVLPRNLKKVTKLELCILPNILWIMIP